MSRWLVCTTCGLRAEAEAAKDDETCPGWPASGGCGGAWEPEQAPSQPLPADALRRTLRCTSCLGARQITVPSAEHDGTLAPGWRCACGGYLEIVAPRPVPEMEWNDQAGRMVLVNHGAARTTVDQPPPPDLLAELREEAEDRALEIHRSDVDAVALALGLGERPRDLGDIEWQALVEEEAGRLRARASLLDDAVAVLAGVESFDLTKAPATFESRRLRLDKRLQRDGSALWTVGQGRHVLTRDGEWEWEPQPSSRDDAFLARTRFSFDEACDLVQRHVGADLDREQLRRVHSVVAAALA